MDIQFVFGNPVKAKKKGKRSMAKKAKKRGLTRDKHGRFIKRSGMKRKRRRNPEMIEMKKGSKRRVYRGLIQGDVNSLKGVLGRAEKLLAAAVTEDGKKKAGRVASRTKKLLSKVETKFDRDVKRYRKMQADGWVKGDHKQQPFTGSEWIEGKLGALKGSLIRKRKRKAASKKKKGAKKKYTKKSSKKKTSKKRSNPVAKSKHKKAKKKSARKLIGKMRLATAARKATPKHPFVAFLKGKKKKRARVTVRRAKFRRNPFGGDMIQSYLAHSAGEAGGLLLGGALYGTVGSLLGKIPVIGPQLVSTLRKVPVVGPSLPTLLAGVLLVKLGERQRIDALRMVGKGLIGATVVGIGVNASQLIPGLGASGAPKLAGVDYTSLDGVDYTSLGADDVDGADFGSLGHDAQMGEQAYGELPEGLSGVDYTMGDGADFGELPAGLGEGQMG